MTVSSKNINTVQDYEAIKSVLENYADCLRKGDVEQLKKIFHNDATMYGYWEQQFIGGSITNLYDSVATHGAAPQLKVHIDVLYKTKNAAMARVAYENNAAGKDGTDLHSLIKINGEWKVISKLFQIPEN